MLSFQIGRIENRWTNFVPPIQGGQFRPYSQDDSESDDSSPPRSRTPSIIFDEAIDEKTGLRRRPSTATSTSSSPSTLPADRKSGPRPLFLDARTQQEIAADLAKYPPVDNASQDAIVQKYRELYRRLEAAGLFQCNYSAYLIESCRYTLFAALSYIFLRLGWYGTSAFFLGCLWHQLVFTVHDSAHIGITHNYHFDTVLAILIADFIGGLSAGWWKRSHNVHHIVTNSAEHDPDIQHLPFFAVSHKFFTNIRSTYYDRVLHFDAASRFLLKFQHYLYYVILAFARFNLYRLSWEYLLKRQAPRKGPAWWHYWLEVTGQVVFWYWFGYRLLYLSIPDWGNRILFLLVSHVTTSPLHVQITLSHFSMSTADLGVRESFPQKMLRTTMDVDCPAWLDFFHGGLQFQAVHHLFPRLPRHNLRAAQQYVKEFCKETGIPYTIFTFVDGNKDVVSHLGEIAKQVRMMEECTKSMTKEGMISYN